MEKGRGSSNGCIKKERGRGRRGGKREGAAMALVRRKGGGREEEGREEGGGGRRRERGEGEGGAVWLHQGGKEERRRERETNRPCFMVEQYWESNFSGTEAVAEAWPEGVEPAEAASLLRSRSSVAVMWVMEGRLESWEEEVLPLVLATPTISSVFLPSSSRSSWLWVRRESFRVWSSF